MRAVICVPWRAGQPIRDAVWRDLVRPHLEGTGLPIFTGDSDPDKPFNRSQARNRAAKAAGDFDVVVFNDADAVIPYEGLQGAIDGAHAEGLPVVPYESVTLYDPTLKQVMGVSEGASGTIVLPRNVWDAVGGWDERFVTYGWEDTSFTKVMNVLYGGMMSAQCRMLMFDHERVGAERIHVLLPHPELADRYAEASDPDAILRILREPGGPLGS